MNDQERGRLVFVLHRLIEIAIVFEKMKPVEEVTLSERDQVTVETLALLTELTALKKELAEFMDQITGEQVNRLRHLKVSWAKIGETLGMTGQAAYQKAKKNGWVTDWVPS